jgi:hypothetical protein
MLDSSFEESSIVCVYKELGLKMVVGREPENQAEEVSRSIEGRYVGSAELGLAASRTPHVTPYWLTQFVTLVRVMDFGVAWNPVTRTRVVRFPDQPAEAELERCSLWQRAPGPSTPGD